MSHHNLRTRYELTLYVYAAYIVHIYLIHTGTKPPMNSVMKQVRELDYDQVEAEHRSLLQVM